MELIDLRNNFTYYYDFYYSAKNKNFAEAAKKSFVTASSLNRSVTKLEEILGLKLLFRNNAGFTLTLDGERLYKTLDEVFLNSHLLKLENVNEKLDVVLTIGTTRNIADYLLSDYLIKFNNLYPNVKISIITDSATNLNEYLLNHKIDVLIDYLPHINFTEKYDLTIIPIAKYSTCFACSKQYYERIKSKINSLNDLKNLNMKVVLTGNSRRRQMLDEVLQVSNVELNPIMLMPDSKLMADVVKNNNFIGYFIEEEIKEYNLVKLEMKEKMPVNTIGIIYSKNTLNNVGYNFVNLVLNKDKNEDNMSSN